VIDRVGLFLRGGVAGPGHEHEGGPGQLGGHVAANGGRNQTIVGPPEQQRRDLDGAETAPQRVEPVLP